MESSCGCCVFFFFGSFVFFFNDTATTEIYTLSLHDALPIHPILLATGLNDLVELRAMYTNMDDRITRTPGDWSEPKSISGQIGQPVIEIEDVRAKYGAPSTAPVKIGRAHV